MSQQDPTAGSLKQSRDLIRKQKYPEAAELLQKVLEQDDKDEDALELLGMARFLGKELEAARDAFEQLTVLNPGHAAAWVNLGAVLNRLGDFKKASEVLRRGLQKNRKCAEGYYNMGITQRGLNLNTMAISAYKEAIKLNPDLIEAHLNLGNIYVEMNNLGLALQCFQAATRIDPKSKKARSSLENAQQRQKKARKVESPFGRLVDVAELDQQQFSSAPRVLDTGVRTAERQLVQEVTKKVRTSAKELVGQLDDPLHASLFRIQRIILQSENRLASEEPLEAFSETLGELVRLRSEIAEGLGEIRLHFAETE